MSDIVKAPPQAIVAQQYSNEDIALLKRTIMRGTTDDEFKLFLNVCKHTGLDPFSRQVFPVKRWNKKADREDVTFQTSIDGLRAIADRTGCYAGSDDYVFDDEKNPKKATATIYKMVQGQRFAFTASARWDQYYPGKGIGFMWDKMPHLMLGKCAESLALRKAFPTQMSGVYSNEEMGQANLPTNAPRISQDLAEMKDMTPDDVKAAQKIEDYGGMADTHKTANKAPYWVSKYNGKEYINATTGEHFDAAFLEGLGMSKSKKPGKERYYGALFSEHIQLALDSAYNERESIIAQDSVPNSDSGQEDDIKF